MENNNDNKDQKTEKNKFGLPKNKNSNYDGSKKHTEVNDDDIEDIDDAEDSENTTDEPVNKKKEHDDTDHDHDYKTPTAKNTDQNDQGKNDGDNKKKDLKITPTAKK